MSSASRRRPPSIKVVAALFVVLPVAVVSGVLVALLWATARRTGEALGASLLDHAASMVADDVRGYLGEAMRVSDLYALRIQDATLPLDDLGSWERAIYEDLSTSPGVASICLGMGDGRAVYMQRANGRIEFGLGDGPGPEQCREWEVGAYGVRAPTPLRVYRYDPVERPWYRAALGAGAAVWTPVYSWFPATGGDAENGSGYARPVRTRDGAIAGVLTIDVTLSALSDFLRRIPAGEGSHLFLIDHEGRLVATTDGQVMGADGQRATLATTSSASARAAARVVDAGAATTRDEGDAPGLSRDGHASGVGDVEGSAARVVVTPLSPMPGLHWRLVTVVPESVFMRDARAALTRSLLIAGVCVVAAGVLAVRLGDRLVQPIVALRAHMRRLARGEFDTPLALHASRELEDLSRDLNAAAVDLKNHVEVKHSLDLAMQVQQSLLPGEPPRRPGLDLAGKSTYCDQTGGDYFDFIDVLDLPPAPDAARPHAGTLVVVGDVMGHGVAAALLMATARATLRSRVRQPASLGRILTDVNAVLAPDFREGRFMTMALLLLNAQGRCARWASAGHDAPIVYEPRADRFRVLDGGDFPLGVVEGTEYREYELDDLEPGTVLAIGTDGIWEATNPAGEAFGHDRLRSIIRQHAGAPAQRIAQAIDQALAEFLGTSRAADDVTYAIARLAE